MGPPGDDDAPANKPTRHAARVENAYNGHAARLRAIAERKFNIPQDDAEAIVNEVFASFLSRQESVRDSGKWLVGAVCHASRAYWRTAAKTSQFPDDFEEYVDPDSPNLERRIVDRVTMAMALNQLDPKSREILRMFYAEGYSSAEIAERLGTSSGYVMQLLHGCRKRVRQVYDALKRTKE